jgi:hypothetical protein
LPFPGVLYGVKLSPGGPHLVVLSTSDFPQS